MSELLIHAGRAFLGSGLGSATAPSTPVLQDAWVRIQDDRIAEITSSEPQASAGAVRIEAPDATLLPGLIDCHVHFAIGGGPDWLSEMQESYAMGCFQAVQRAQATLRAGFTSVRTLGGRPGLEVALRDAQRAGLVAAPRIVPANLAICMTGGHGSWIGREADGPEDVRKAVREQLKAGADCIKLIATGGVMTPLVEPGSQQLTDAEIQAGIEEAHKAGRKVAAHAHGAQGIRAAVLAGVDSIEHGSYLDDELISLMRERGTFYSATLCAPRGFLDAPPGSIADWAIRKGNAVRVALDDSFRRAYQAGVRLVLGTDAGTPFNPHGNNARELALMAELGVSPLDALQAGTRNGAELLGLADELGSIEVGKLADLVLCQGDATHNVELLTDQRNIRLVVQSGRIVHQPQGAAEPRLVYSR